MDKVAIVILNWNGKKMLEQYMPKLMTHLGEGTFVYVADNASTDDSMEFLRAHYPEVRLIQLEKNWGFAEGYNKALEKVTAEYYVLLNSDVEVTEGWLDRLVEYMDEHPEVAACQPKLRAVHNHESFEYAGASGGFLDKYGYPFCRGRIFDTVEKDLGQYDDVVEVLWATGACLMIRRDDYWKVGGLDARFFAHNEEIDMCWRLWLMGKKVVCLPQSVVYHVGGGTLPKGNPMKTYLNFRNNLTMLYKNLPDKELKKVMCMRWILDYVAAFQTLVFNRNVGDFKAIFRARRDFRKWLPEFQDDRKRIQKESAGMLIPTRVHYSILYMYYLKRRKYYSEIK